MVIVPDLEGLLHCVDAATGKPLWIYNLSDDVFSSPMIIGDRIYMATQSTFSVFALSQEKQLIGTYDLSGTESSPVFANGTLYVMTKARLYAIRE